MPNLNAIRNYLFGLVLVFLTPSFLGLFVAFLIAIEVPEPSFLGGQGPVCALLYRKEVAAPSGFFIAISTRVVCEDETYRKMEPVNQIYVRATRWDRAAHLFTMAYGEPVAANIKWLDDTTIQVARKEANTSIYSRPWCGIGVSPLADHEP